METTARQTSGRVRRRHVIYVQGYDPRGLAEYYRMFRSEFRKFCALYGFTGKIGKATNAEDRFTTTWPIDTQGNSWRVETTYEFLRWEDIIRRDFARPVAFKISRAIGALARAFQIGSFAKIWRAHWRFAVFTLYPYGILLLNLVISGIGGWLAAKAAALVIGAPVLTAAVGLAAAVALFLFQIRRTETWSYMLYMFDDITSLHQYGRRDRPDWEERFEIFAGYVVEAAQNSNAHEVLLVGHSSGSFVAIDVLTRALALDPDLGRHGSRISLLTVGANLPTVGFHPWSGWFRDKLRRLAVEPSIDWVDYQSRKDAMNFYPFDPIAGHGIDVGGARHNPTVVSIRFRDIIKPENYSRFRWRFFKVHFQFLKANERRGSAYDYYMMCCGPFDLMTRATRPAEVVAAIDGDNQPGSPNTAG